MKRQTNGKLARQRYNQKKVDTFPSTGYKEAAVLIPGEKFSYEDHNNQAPKWGLFFPLLQF